ncbi:MAG: alpha/beta family hydrolase [Betaproteobacteria bacterium]
MNAQPLTIAIDDTQSVSGLLQTTAKADACYVMAHGAGAGMTHPFLAAVADGLAQRDIATLRYQFPYMERGSKRPDAPQVAQTAVRVAVAEAARRLPGLPLFAGGKSFGGRMTSQAQAVAPLPGVRGLVFFAFPLHPAGRPSAERAVHLAAVRVPLLFLQGTRDQLADLALLQGLGRKLGTRTTLELFEHADHSFHVPARTGRTDAGVREDMLDRCAAWIATTLGR